MGLDARLFYFAFAFVLSVCFYSLLQEKPGDHFSVTRRKYGRREEDEYRRTPSR